jgi:hypothetical protein
MTRQVDVQRTEKILGRHTRLTIGFQFTMGGEIVHLQEDGYSAQVWLKDPDGAVSGPFVGTVVGDRANYTLDSDSADVASTETPDRHLEIVCVVTNSNNTLVSDIRELVIGDWPGSVSLDD